MLSKANDIKSNFHFGEYKMQTETKTASSSNTGYILNFST